ncbi:uncharacterized protein LOC123524265 [Mercenaria mercenaria]|uniref:uncharacterized protein LOC123524265 n=1 Tax=Mercenaria mercenaria TaxID=6596 RepID=UPI00234F4328|nr:uncharacterized protein LOC123524265 [Mercenaria mercenaria]
MRGRGSKKRSQTQNSTTQNTTAKRKTMDESSQTENDVEHVRLCDAEDSENPDIWILSDSILYWAGKRANDMGQPNLSLPNNTSIGWFGVRGLKWIDFHRQLQRRMLQNTSLRVIVIHLGGNDLTSISICSLIRKVSESIRYLFQTFPDAVIVWLDIFQRILWSGAESVKSVEVKRKRINYIGLKLVSENSRGRHFTIDIDHKNSALFRPVGVHLSDTGLDLTLEALKSFLIQFAR